LTNEYFIYTFFYTIVNNKLLTNEYSLIIGPMIGEYSLVKVLIKSNLRQFCMLQ